MNDFGNDTATTFAAAGPLLQIAPAGGALPGALSAAGGLLLHVVTAVLALLIVLRCAVSLLRGRVDEESWGFFSCPTAQSSR